MPQRGTPSYLYFILILSLAFLGSQLLMSLLLKTSDILDEIDIFQSLTAGGQSNQPPESGSLDDGNKHQVDDTNNILCSPGYFQLNNDGICHPMLNCKDFQDDINAIQHIGAGAVKQVYLARWKKYQVILSNLSQPSFNNDFLYGAKMLQQFQPSPFVIQLLGFCPSIPALVTEYHILGSLEHINRILKENGEDNVVTRFRLCLDYVKIIHFLHTSPTGTHVMCDSNDLTKTLSQFLVTADLHLVINDLDALPLVDSSKGVLIKCGHREIVGDFVAPEQLWPYSGVEFKDADMPNYDEKTDIWKIPGVVDFLLGEDVHGDVVRFNLFKLHQKCGNKDPKLRPTAAEVLKGYLDVQKTLKL